MNRRIVGWGCLSLVPLLLLPPIIACAVVAAFSALVSIWFYQKPSTSILRRLAPLELVSAVLFATMAVGLWSLDRVAIWISSAIMAASIAMLIPFFMLLLKLVRST